MSDDTKKSVTQWVSIGITVIGAALYCGRMQSQIANTADSLKANWAADAAFRDTTAATDRAFREKVIGDLATLNAKMDTVLRKP